MLCIKLDLCISNNFESKWRNSNTQMNHLLAQYIPLGIRMSWEGKELT